MTLSRSARAIGGGPCDCIIRYSTACSRLYNQYKDSAWHSHKKITTSGNHLSDTDWRFFFFAAFCLPESRDLVRLRSMRASTPDLGLGSRTSDPGRSAGCTSVRKWKETGISLWMYIQYIWIGHAYLVPAAGRMGVENSSLVAKVGSTN